MHIMNNFNALYPLITLYNALYIKALSKVLPNCFINFIIYILIFISAVKRLIASKIKVFVYIINVCVLCIFIMYI